MLVWVCNLLCCFRKFVSSPNFTHWFMLRREEANQKLRLLHLDTLCRAVSLFLLFLLSFFLSLPSSLPPSFCLPPFLPLSPSSLSLPLLSSSLSFTIIILAFCMQFSQDMAFWIRGKQEVEIVDFLIQVKESMVRKITNNYFAALH